MHKIIKKKKNWLPLFSDDAVSPTTSFHPHQSLRALLPARESLAPSTSFSTSSAMRDLFLTRHGRASTRRAEAALRARGAKRGI